MMAESVWIQPMYDILWANILSRLSPIDIAHVAQTCRALSRTAREITSIRSSDACQGHELFSVPFINDIDEKKYSYFKYLKHCNKGSELVSNSVSTWGLSEFYSFDLEDGNVLKKRSDHFSKQQFGIYFFEGGCKCVQRIKFSNTTKSHSLNHVDVSCDHDDCFCGLTMDGDKAYDVHGRLCLISNQTSQTAENTEVFELDSEVDNQFSIFECGPGCFCDITCANRTSQRGLAVNVQVVKHKRKGWGLHAAQNIASGAFVCEYAGELLTTREAKMRQNLKEKNGASYLLVVKEHLPSGNAVLRLNIDPIYFGNIARFINHCCDGGNLLPCVVRCHGWPIPRVSLFARRDIQCGEELSFSYGSIDVNATNKDALQKCFCEALSCNGVLPNERT